MLSLILEFTASRNGINNLNTKPYIYGKKHLKKRRFFFIFEVIII